MYSASGGGYNAADIRLQQFIPGFVAINVQQVLEKFGVCIQEMQKVAYIQDESNSDWTITCEKLFYPYPQKIVLTHINGEELQSPIVNPIPKISWGEDGHTVILSFRMHGQPLHCQGLAILG